MDDLLARITVDPSVCHGKPCVRGLRYPVEVMLDVIGSGMTWAEILEDFDDLEPDDLRAVLAYAARAVHDELLALFDRHIAEIVDLFTRHALLELGRSGVLARA